MLPSLQASTYSAVKEDGSVAATATIVTVTIRANRCVALQGMAGLPNMASAFPIQSTPPAETGAVVR